MHRAGGGRVGGEEEEESVPGAATGLVEEGIFNGAGDLGG
jgi:hypothetical protein